MDEGSEQIDQNQNFIDLKQVVIKGLGKIEGRDVYPVFNSIKRIDGILYCDISEYSDAFGNRYPLDDINPKIYRRTI